jgi:tetratricopeptide (TPR) repeat protein
MTQFQVLARRLALAAIVACVFAGTLSAWPSIGEARKSKSGSQPAQPAQGPQPAQGGGDDSDANQKAAATAAARKAYDAGLKEFAAGRSQTAVEQLSTAIKSGVLSGTEMAKALYTRGLAYKKENKPGQAISDLTSAIWLKNGLSDIEKKAALAERSEAYRMAGLEDTGSTPDRPAIGAAAPAAPGSNIVANPAPGPNAGSAGLSAAAIAEAAAGSKSAVPGSNGGSAATITHQDSNGDSNLQSAASSTVTGGESTAPASTGILGWAQPAEAASGSGASEGSSGSSSFGQTVSAIPGNVTGFFSNMFGGGPSTPAPEGAAPPAASVMTASTTPAETSSWNNATIVAAGGSTKNKAPKAEKVALATESKPKSVVATKGKYKIHIAALRSRAEAEALAQQLVTQHGADLSNHVPTVDEAVIGSMGTFYRVRIGVYASQEEPRGLCNKLRSSGLDCLVVTN